MLPSECKFSPSRCQCFVSRYNSASRPHSSWLEAKSQAHISPSLIACLTSWSEVRTGSDLGTPCVKWCVKSCTWIKWRSDICCTIWCLKIPEVVQRWSQSHGCGHLQSMKIIMSAVPESCGAMGKYRHHNQKWALKSMNSKGSHHVFDLNGCFGVKEKPYPLCRQIKLPWEFSMDI